MDTYNSTQLIEQFNAKDRQARKYAFNISNTQIMALYAYLLGMGAPLMMIDVHNFNDFMLISRRILRLPYAKLAKDEADIPAAIANHVRQVLFSFFELIPLTLDVFEKYLANYSAELSEMEIGTQNQFVTFSLGIYLSSFRGGKTHETLSADDYYKTLEKSVSSCLRNLPTMRGLRNNDHHIVSRLIDASCEYSISKSLWGVFESCCRKYGSSLLHLDGGLYYDFEAKVKNPKAMKDAYLTFQSEAMIIIWDNREKLSLRVPSIKTYLDAIVRDIIVDRITRGSTTRTAASYKTVGEETCLDNVKEAKLEYERPEPLDEKTLDEFKKKLFRAANLADERAKKRREVLEYMILTGEDRPRFIAKEIKGSVNSITSRKSRAVDEVRTFLRTAEGKLLTKYYGVKC